MADDKKTTSGMLNRFTDAARGGTMLTPVGMLTTYVDHQFGSSVRVGVRDFIRDTVGMATWLAVDAGHNESGDRMTSNRVATDFQEWWNKHISGNNADKQFDFRMAHGWKWPQGVPYNGKLPSADDIGKEIDVRSAVFVRARNGDLSIIDHKDPRYYQVVPAYIATQLASSLGGLGTAGSKLITGERLVDKFARHGINTTGKMAGMSEGVSSVAYVGNALRSGLVLEPAAIERFARLIENPQAMTLDKLTTDINTVLKKFSYDRGPMTEQYYVESLNGNKRTITLMDQLSRGRVAGYEMAHPFDPVTDKSKTGKYYKEELPIQNIRDVRENPYFQASFYKLAEKAFITGTLTPSEQMALRFGLNIAHHTNIGLTGSAVDANGTAQYSVKDTQETMLALRRAISDVRVGRLVEAEEKKKGNTDPEKVNQEVFMAMNLRAQLKAAPYPDKDLLTTIHEDVVRSTAAVNKIEQEKLEKAKLRSQGFAMAMVPL